MGVRSTIDWLLARRVMEQAKEEIARKAVEYMAERARFYCPVDTGYLVSTIFTVPETNGEAWNVVVTAPYAVFVELGYLHVGGTWIPPNPFLRNAMADTAAHFPEIARSVRFASTSSADVMHVNVSP